MRPESGVGVKFTVNRPCAVEVVQPFRPPVRTSPATADYVCRMARCLLLMFRGEPGIVHRHSLVARGGREGRRLALRSIVVLVPVEKGHRWPRARRLLGVVVGNFEHFRPGQTRGRGCAGTRTRRRGRRAFLGASSGRPPFCTRSNTARRRLIPQDAGGAARNRRWPRVRPCGA